MVNLPSPFQSAPRQTTDCSLSCKRRMFLSSVKPLAWLGPACKAWLSHSACSCHHAETPFCGASASCAQAAAGTLRAVVEATSLELFFYVMPFFPTEPPQTIVLAMTAILPAPVWSGLPKVLIVEYPQFRWARRKPK